MNTGTVANRLRANTGHGRAGSAAPTPCRLSCGISTTTDRARRFIVPPSFWRRCASQRKERLMPMRLNDYPPDWHAISARVRQRNGGRCEWCNAVNGQPHPVTGSRVVLTVAHLGTVHADGSPGDKHDKFDVREENLASLCMNCHLRFDLPDHMRNASETRRRKREQAGQRVLAL